MKKENIVMWNNPISSLINYNYNDYNNRFFFCLILN